MLFNGLLRMKNCSIKKKMALTLHGAIVFLHCNIYFRFTIFLSFGYFTL
jgi:hypothetical protein